MIASVDVPTERVSNITAVWKPDKKQVRICLDPRDLNKAIRRNHFYMPTINDVLPKLKGAKNFCLLDAKDGFLQVKLTERSSYLGPKWAVPIATYAIRDFVGSIRVPETASKGATLTVRSCSSG